MIETLKTPTRGEQQLANANVKEIEHLARNYQKKYKAVDIEIKDEKVHIKIPSAALGFLSTILQLMAKGKAISIIPSDSEVSTQQAAEILNVSRPHIVKLLEQGKIPYHKVGTHRRIKLADIERYRQEKAEERRENLSKLSKQAQELDMGY